MVNIERYGKFKEVGKSKTKRQIILCHTSREANEYIASLKFRYNGKYDKIPNYLILKDGKVLQLLSNESYSSFLESEKANRNSIIISLENLGWLDKKPLTNNYINWKGSIYNKTPHEKKWRDYFFWDPYTNEQIDSLIELCDLICDQMSISKQCSGHNTRIEGIENFGGIVTRSNYDSRFTDLNPSFSFEKLEKKFENEQISR